MEKFVGANKVVFSASHRLQGQTSDEAKFIFKDAMSPTRAKISLMDQGTLLV